MCECAVQVGSKIRIVRPWRTKDLYRKGDVLKVAKINKTGVEVSFDGYVDDDGTNMWHISESEFEVVEC